MPEQDDPLWLHSPRKRLGFQAACLALALALAIWAPWPLSLIGALFLLAALRLGMPTAIGWVGERLRALWWRDREGIHHSFAGVPLSVHDDGRHLWLQERGVRALLGLERDPRDVLKARFSGHWREARELGLKGEALWLDVQALHRHLAEAPERLDPKRVRLRAYLDRELLQPAARRRAR